MNEYRALILLEACKDFLEKQDKDILAQTVFYDEAECDGNCLLEDIKIFLETGC